MYMHYLTNQFMYSLFPLSCMFLGKVFLSFSFPDTFTDKGDIAQRRTRQTSSFHTCSEARTGNKGEYVGESQGRKEKKKAM